jgi:thiol-disulfide isomerase/thioredoxin
VAAAETSAAPPLVEVSQFANAPGPVARATELQEQQPAAFGDERSIAQSESGAMPRKRTTWQELDSSPKEPSIQRTTMNSPGPVARPRPAASPIPSRRLTNEELLALPRRGEELEPPEPKPKPKPTIKAYCRIDAKQRQLIDFQLPDLEGRLVRFQDFDADLILLDFWGTWCQPCVKSVPHLVKIQKIADAQKARGLKQLQVIGIACEQGPNSEKLVKANRAVRDLGINYPVLMSGMESDPCPVLDVFNIQYFPTMVLLDREGHVLWADQGATPSTLARLDAFLANAMKGTGSSRK